MKRRATAVEADVGTAGFATATVLVGAAFAGAATAGTLSTVGPYLLAVSGLVGLLFVLCRRTQ